MAESIPGQDSVRARSEQERPVEESRGVQAPDQTVGQATNGECSARAMGRSNEGRRERKDKGHLHTTRHAALSRYPLEALRQLGEDVKPFRRLEHRLRTALKPRGEIAAILFDRLWSSYLRCILVARLERGTFVPAQTPASPSCSIPTLLERDVPTLVLPEGGDSGVIRAALPPDVFRELVLVQRYDRHFAREMYRALAMLLILRSGGEAGLEQCFVKILGVSSES